MKKYIKLDNILADRTSGSEQILSDLNNYLLAVVNNREVIETALIKVKANLSHFSVIENYTAALEKTLTSADTADVKIFLAGFNNSSINKFLLIYNNAKTYLKNTKTVLTLSNSKTLLEVFKLWAKDRKSLRIIICESRPKYEGRIFSNLLLKENIKVEIITDAMISLYIPKVDSVVLDADSILKNGNVINKTGSLSAALLCKQFNKPFYIFADRNKFSINNKFIQAKQSEDEVWKYRHKNLKISNYYFEEIPKELITNIFSS